MGKCANLTYTLTSWNWALTCRLALFINYYTIYGFIIDKTTWHHQYSFVVGCFVEGSDNREGRDHLAEYGYIGKIWLHNQGLTISFNPYIWWQHVNDLLARILVLLTNTTDI